MLRLKLKTAMPSYICDNNNDDDDDKNDDNNNDPTFQLRAFAQLIQH